jgi:hypothetical protein
MWKLHDVQTPCPRRCQAAADPKKKMFQKMSLSLSFKTIKTLSESIFSINTFNHHGAICY